VYTFTHPYNDGHYSRKCMRVYAYIYIYIHTDVHTYTRTHIHTYTHTYINTDINTHVQTRTYKHAYIHTNIHINIHTHRYATTPGFRWAACHTRVEIWYQRPLRQLSRGHQASVSARLSHVEFSLSVFLNLSLSQSPLAWKFGIKDL